MISYEDKYKPITQRLDKIIELLGQDVPVHKEPEARKKPREFWINKGSVTRSGFGYKYTAQEEILTPSDAGYWHVTEIPPGYRLVSRDEVYNAIRKGIDRINTPEALLRELGFDNG